MTALLERILVAVDLAEGTETTIGEAVRVGVATGLPLTLLRASGASERATVETRLRALTGAARDLGAEATDPLIEDGKPADAVLRHAAGSLIVLGPGNKSALARALIGSTVESVLRASPSPVWLVRPGHQQRLKRILVAVDDAPHAKRAVEAALFFARALGAKLDLFRAFPESSSRAASLPEQRKKLTQLAAAFDTSGVEVELVAWEGDPAEQIVQAALTRKVDLLALGSASRRGLGRFLQTNMSERVARQLPCSLLSVPA